MPKGDLLKKLNKAVDRSARLAIKNGYPLQTSSNTAIIGNVSVEKNINNFYNIISVNKTVLYENILLYDIAILIAQRHYKGEQFIIKQILLLEEKYAKYHTDMLHYLHCLKVAKSNHDLERMAILEDKFQVAEQLAKHVKESITVFKK
jgi:hypothetical protein